MKIKHLSIYFFLGLTLFYFGSCSKAIRSLKEIDVKKISLRTDNNGLLLQGTKTEIGLITFTADNHIYATQGKLKGKLRWKNFKVEAEGATFSNGKLNIQHQPFYKYKSTIPVKFWSVYQPQKIFYDTIRLNYEKQIDLFATGFYYKLPGSTVPFGMKITYDNNVEKTYKDINKIPDFDEDYEIFVRASTYRRSSFKVYEDFLDIPDHKSGVMIQLRRDENVFSALEITLDYKAAFKHSASGFSGMNGFSGMWGSTGSTSQNGQNGQHGEPASHGQNGHDLDIYVDAYFDTIINETLLKVYIGDLYTEKAKRYLVNTKGGSLHVSAQGGYGGEGGDGGHGGNGGNGKNGDFYTETIREYVTVKDTAGHNITKEITHEIRRQRPGGDGADGGSGGWGGPGGNGGNGGSIIVFMTEAAKPYTNLLNIYVEGGMGGRGGNGGRGGSGGAGGSGNPPGKTGRNGLSGLNGPSGYSGYNGRIEFRNIDQIPW